MKRGLDYIFKWGEKDARFEFRINNKAKEIVQEHLDKINKNTYNKKTKTDIMNAALYDYLIKHNIISETS